MLHLFDLANIARRIGNLPLPETALTPVVGQVAEVHSGRVCQGHFGRRLHFGPGTREEVDRIEVRWPGGKTTVLTNVEIDRLMTVTKQTGR